MAGARPQIVSDMFSTRKRSPDRVEVLKILRAHEQTIAVCDACATTTRELATEVARGGVPSRADLVRTIEESERVLAELETTRRELQRLIAGFS
jgi:hypothetical protein